VVSRLPEIECGVITDFSPGADYSVVSTCVTRGMISMYAA
jgi:hypothetical protein